MRAVHLVLVAQSISSTQAPWRAEHHTVIHPGAPEHLALGRHRAHHPKHLTTNYIPSQSQRGLWTNGRGSLCLGHNGKGENVKERGINSKERRKKAAVLGIFQLGFEGWIGVCQVKAKATSKAQRHRAGQEVQCCEVVAGRLQADMSGGELHER